MNKRRLKVGDKQKCRLCGDTFLLEQHKMNAKYCNRCKYKAERRMK